MQVFGEISDGQMFNDASNVQTAALSKGKYDVQLILTNDKGCVDSVTYENYLQSMAKPVATILRYAPSEPTMFNTKVNFDNFSDDAVEFEWNFENADPAYSTEVSPEVYFPDGQSGSYEVYMIASSSFGCSDTMYDVIEILPRSNYLCTKCFYTRWKCTQPRMVCINSRCRYV